MRFAAEDTGGGIQLGSARTSPGGPKGVVKSSSYRTHVRISGGGGPEACGLLLDPRQFNSLGVSQWFITGLPSHNPPYHPRPSPHLSKNSI